MVNRIDFPAPLKRKLMLTLIIGVVCFLIGVAMFLLLKDQTSLLLSLAILTMCVGKTISMYQVVNSKGYEVVLGTCTAVYPQVLRKYRKIVIQDCEGNEISLLLDKMTKVKLGCQYRFYFKETDRLTFGNEYFDSALNSDCFLGYEEVSTAD